MDVKPETLANCVRKAGFVKNVEVSHFTLWGLIQLLNLASRDRGTDGRRSGTMESEANDDELNAPWDKLEGMNLAEGILDDYLAMDDQLATGGTLTLAEIAAEFSSTEVEETKVDSKSEVMEIKQEEPELPPITTQDAREALKILNHCYYSNPAMLELCNNMGELMAEERLKNLKQKNIHDFFRQPLIVYLHATIV